MLGFSTFIPDWIKAYTKNWAVGDVSDDEFMTGLDFMLQNKIIVIPNFTYDDSSIDLSHHGLEIHLIGGQMN